MKLILQFFLHLISLSSECLTAWLIFYLHLLNLFSKSLNLLNFKIGFFGDHILGFLIPLLNIFKSIIKLFAFLLEEHHLAFLDLLV